MPTYVCSVPPQRLTKEQKTEIATAIGRRHSDATGAPAFFVQVDIDESPTKLRFLGGTLSDAHIWIRGDIRAGRTDAVRQTLMLNIMKDVSAITGVKEQDIWIYLCNLVPTDMVEFGRVLPVPGEEQAWFESLPAHLQAYMLSLGTTGKTFKL
ncbi:tautomerase family protein [Dyella sp.]|uniref:tautomerase family protein n=1 Tax=Dyella sp. TaxID=1869338 RepID=UPI002ED38E34